MTLALLAIFTITRNASALEADRDLSQYAQRRWEVSDGLPSSVVHSIAQTPDGYLWLATETGLVRFDGARFLTHDHHNTRAIRSDYFWSTKVAPDGTLWIGGSGGGGLLRRPPGGRIQKGRVGFRIPMSEAFAMDLAPDGSLWIATPGGVVRMHGRNGRAVFLKGLPAAMARAIRVMRDGSVWIGTTAGLARLHNGKVTAFGAGSGLPAVDVRTIHEDRDGVIRVGTMHGLYELRGGRFVRHRSPLLSQASIWTIVQDSDGTLWIGTHAGLWRMGRRGSAEILDRAMESDSIHSIFEDREGSLWIGSTAGLTQFRETTVIPFGRPEGLRSEMVQAFAEDRDGSIWIGTNNGLGRWRKGRIEWIGKGTQNLNIYSLAMAIDGSLWIGTFGSGACRYNGGQLRCFGRGEGLTHDAVTSVVPDAEGGVWLGTLGGGINYFRDGRVRRVWNKSNSALMSDRVVMLAKARNGGIWVGTVRGGISFLHRETLRPFFTQFKGRSPLTPRSIAEDGNGNVWVGLTGTGLIHYRNGKVTRIPMRGLTGGDNLQQVLSDSAGWLWLTGNAGITRVRIADLLAYIDGRIKHVPAERFTTTSGMRSPESIDGEPSAIIARDGSLWFGTNKGAARIIPARMHRNQLAPPVLVEEVTSDGQAMLPGDSTMKPGTKRASFRFTGNTLALPEHARFRYKLEGFDRDWIDAGPQTRVATYTNIPPGKYVFRVRAANADGVWNEPGAAYPFERAPAFRETSAFTVLIGGAILLAGVILFHARVRQMRRRERVLAELVNQRTSELQVANQSLRRISLTDALTGVANRRHFDQCMQLEWRRSARNNVQLAVLLMDVDFFKLYNDRYGHQDGDECLRRIGAALRESVGRAGDLVARYGGEEFAVVLPNTDSDAAQHVAEIIRRRVVGAAIPHQDSTVSECVTVSIGVAAMKPAAGIHWSEVIGLADAALYKAKRAGRNRVSAHENTPRLVAA